MIKIAPGKTDGDTRLGGKKSPSAARSSGGANFESILSSAVGTETELAVESLMGDLSEQEKRFLDMQSEYELMKYKTLLQKVLKMLVSESYQTKVINRNSRNRADFLIVNQINSKVDSLSKIMTSPGNKAFNLMKTLEEIRGLIYDLRF